jgi:hypothetical protein
MMMKIFLRPVQPARLLVLAFALGCSPPLLAQDLPFNGRWLLDNPPPAQAAYTSLTIKDGSMSWNGPDKSLPKCTQRFVLQQERPGTMYTNARGTKFMTGVTGSLPTYLLKIHDGTCAGSAAEVRISFPLVYDTRHIEVVDYVQGKPVGFRRFHRKK